MNSRDFERVVHSCRLAGKVASDMDRLALLVADRVLKQETKDREIKCKNAQKYSEVER